MTDPDILALTQEIALLDARIADLINRVDSGDAGVNYEQAMKAYRRLATALRTGDSDAVADAMNELGSTLRAGRDDSRAWGKAQEAIQQRRALVQTERQRLMDMEQLVQVGDMLALADNLLLAIRENIDDRAALSRIQIAFNSLLNRQVESGTD